MRSAGIVLIASAALACDDGGDPAARRRRDRPERPIAIRDAGAPPVSLIPADAAPPLPDHLPRDPAADVRTTGLPPGAVMRIGLARWRMSGLSSAAPGNDGSVLTCNPGQVRRWDPTGHLAGAWPLAASGDARCVRSPDGRRLLVVGSYRPPTMYDVATGQPAWDLGTSTSVRDAAFSADGSRIVIAGDTSELRVADQGTAISSALGTALAAGFRGPDAVILVRTDEVAEWTETGGARRIAGLGVATVGAVSADGSRVVWMGDRIGVVDVETGATLDLAIPGGGTATRISVSPDGALAVANTYDGVHAFDAATGVLRWTARVYGSSTVFAPDGRALWVVSGDRVVRVDPSTGAITQIEDAPTFSGWTAGNAAIYYQGGARAIDPRTGAAVSDTRRFDEPPWDLPDYYYDYVHGEVPVATTGSGRDGCVGLDYWVKGKTRSLPAPDCRPEEEEYLPGWEVGPGVALGHDRSGGTVWDLVTGRKLFALPRRSQEEEFRGVLFSADRSVMLLDRDGLLQSWSIKGRRKLGGDLALSPIEAWALSSDGTRAFVATEGGLDMIDTRTMARRRLSRLPGRIYDLQLSPDDGLLAATDEDRVTTIWRVPK